MSLGGQEAKGRRPRRACQDLEVPSQRPVRQQQQAPGGRARPGRAESLCERGSVVRRRLESEDMRTGQRFFDSQRCVERATRLPARRGVQPLQGARRVAGGVGDSAGPRVASLVHSAHSANVRVQRAW